MRGCVIVAHDPMNDGEHPSVPAPRSLAVRAFLESGALPFALKTVVGGEGLNKLVHHPRIQKSGLALVGHFNGVRGDRVQILGQTEMSFLHEMESDFRASALMSFFGLGLSCVILTGDFEPFPELSAAAAHHDTALLRSPVKSSMTINALHMFLDDRLAPRQRVHGVFVDVFGVGILLLGASGIGKSECGLELVQRGHRLVADDVVECSLRPPDHVYGCAATLLKNHLEVRGLGVLNIKDLFGVAAVRDKKRVDLVLRLTGLDDDESWDRLGIDDAWWEILGVQLPLKAVPVRPGKNTASSIEVAARNELLRQAGHHSARDFHAQLAKALGVQDPSTTKTTVIP